jgi:hypothetical protein
MLIETELLIMNYLNISEKPRLERLQLEEIENKNTKNVVCPQLIAVIKTRKM